MPASKTSRKSLVRFVFDRIGDFAVGTIRLWKALRSPHARKIFAHRRKANQRLTGLEKKREEWEARHQRRLKKAKALRHFSLRGAMRLQRRRFKDFHRRTPVRRLLVLYFAPTAILSLVFTGLLLFVWGNETRITPLPPRPSADQEDLEKVMEKTAQLLSDNRLEEAQPYLDVLNVRAPRDFTVLTYNGAMQVLRKNYPAARTAYAQALEVTPGSPVARFNLAEIEFMSGNYSAAERSYLEMLEGNPLNEVLIFRLVLAALLQNDLPRADLYLAKLNPTVPNPAWHYSTAARLIANKKPGEAARLIQQARTIYGEQTGYYDKALRQIGYIK